MKEMDRLRPAFKQERAVYKHPADLDVSLQNPECELAFGVNARWYDAFHNGEQTYIRDQELLEVAEGRESRYWDSDAEEENDRGTGLVAYTGKEGWWRWLRKKL
jgi:hypothetical protein